MLEVGGSNGNNRDRGGSRGITLEAAAAADEVSVERGLVQLVVGSGYQAPNYGMRYSPEAFKCFFVKYQEYKRNVHLSNRGQSLQRYCLTVFELFPRFVRSCVSRGYFDGFELREDDLKEALLGEACRVLGGC